ncbi:hypothetical protein JL721_9528 [Aureococcus anophagefferens]|nr:hypothetical protein JL721_9528 [Aureococcus anophagefferens]
MKLFVSYKEGEDEAHHMATKFTVPKGWRPGPVAKLLGFSVDTYNAKHKDHLLNVDEVHFAKKDDDGNFEAIGLEDVVEQVLKTKDEVFIAPDAERAGDAQARRTRSARPPEAEAKRVFAIGKHKGCQAKFHPDDNGPRACSYHYGTPVFHETMKWWGCCPHKKKMDFDAFMAVKGCCVGYHWNGEGDDPEPTERAGAPPPIADDDAEVVEAGDEADLG